MLHAIESNVLRVWCTKIARILRIVVQTGEKTWQFDQVTDIITYGLFFGKIGNYGVINGFPIPLCLRFKLYK